MLKKRVITALCIIPILVAAVWFDTPLPWFTIFAAAWGFGAAYEFYKLTSTKAPILTWFGLIWTVLFLVSRNANLLSVLRLDPDSVTPLLLTSGIVLSLVWLLRHPHRLDAFAGWAWTMAGILYLGWLLGYLVALRDLDNGRNWVFLALFATFASDTAAFVVGKSLGRHHLAPHISPAKTWEGSVGGVLGAIIASLFFILPTPLQLGLSWGAAVLLGLIVSVFGQLGDLAESVFKRNMGVKDSGNLIPGHGGVLDRTDSIVFAGIVVYYYVVWMVR
ncbi:MAG: phosphatidate cytidylyltransferase [Chloroflexi bacterium]|nr:phosphatidate cytidylyltransferase [Chloroflexota bacterium]